MSVLADKMDQQFSFVQWIGHSVSLAAIGGTLTGFLQGVGSALAVILAVIWYSIEIYDSRPMRRMIQARKLRMLVRLRARAVALELAIRNQDVDLRALDEANQVHLAAAGKAAGLVHEAIVVERKAEVQKIAEADAKSNPSG